MLNKLDIYIIKKFLGTFFYAIALIVVIIIVFDLSEKLDDFLISKAPIKAIIFDYYLNFIPYFVNQFSGLFTFIAVIFFTSKMASHSEIVAILSGGVSYFRFLRPYFAGGIFLALLSFLLINWIIPKANITRFDFEEKYYRSHPYQNKEHDIHRQIAPDLYIYMQSYSTTSHIGNRFSMERFENGLLKEKLIADYIKWNTTLNKWSIMNYYLREFDSTEEKLTSGRQIDTLLPNFEKIDFSSRPGIVEAMDYTELNQNILKNKLTGSSSNILFELEKQKRFAYPFASIILAIMGVCVSSRKKRGGMGINIGLGLALAFSYILLQQVANVFATNAGISPFVSVWMPNLIYTIITIILYKKAKL